MDNKCTARCDTPITNTFQCASLSLLHYCDLLCITIPSDFTVATRQKLPPTLVVEHRLLVFRSIMKFILRPAGAQGLALE